MSALLCSSCAIGRKITDYVCERDDEISRLDVGHGREIRMTAGVCWEVSRPIYYEITEDGRILVPKTYINGDGGHDEHQYMAIFAEGGSLVGVVEATGGTRVLVVIQDFKTGESWPRVKDDEVSYEEKVVRRHQNLFDRLRKENPALQKPDDLRGSALPDGGGWSQVNAAMYQFELLKIGSVAAHNKRCPSFP